MVSNPDLVELNNPDLAELKHRSFSSCLIKQGLPLEVAISSSSLILCSHTIFEDATPELGRDFFWDGDFPLNWDLMLAYSKTLDEIRQNGATVPCLFRSPRAPSLSDFLSGEWRRRLAVRRRSVLRQVRRFSSCFSPATSTHQSKEIGDRLRMAARSSSMAVEDDYETEQKKQAAADVLFHYSQFVMVCIGEDVRPTDLRLHLMKEVSGMPTSLKEPHQAAASPASSGEPSSSGTMKSDKNEIS